MIIKRSYLSLPFRMISTISFVVIFAFIKGTSKGEDAVCSGVNAKVRPSFLRINTLPVLSACSRTVASFCLASEYVYTCTLNLQRMNAMSRAATHPAGDLARKPVRDQLGWVR